MRPVNTRGSGTGRLELLAYNLGLAVASPVLMAYLLWRVVRGKSRDGWGERWGRLPNAIGSGRREHRPPETGHPEVGTRVRRAWVHAASVGEVAAAKPIIKALKAERDDLDVVMTVITPGGREVAETLAGQLVSSVAYLPFDLPWLMRKAVRLIGADLFIGIETEIWPNLLHALRTHGARCALVNARISDRSYPRYRRVRRLMRWALSQYDAVLAQSAEDAGRFIVLGAAPDAVRTLGNVKFDEAEHPLSAADQAALRVDLGLREEVPVWVAGSTRMPAEERMVWEAHRMVRTSLPDAVLIHAPRHVARADEVEAGMRQVGLKPIRRSRPECRAELTDSIILDTFGELGKVYAVGDVAFIGNSMVPPGGGQNLLQPLAQGKGVLFGPYMSNFRDSAEMALSAGVGKRIATADELGQEVLRALTDRDSRTQVSRKAVELIEANRGASGRYAAALSALLPDHSGLGVGACPGSANA